MLQTFQVVVPWLQSSLPVPSYLNDMLYIFIWQHSATITGLLVLHIPLSRSVDLFPWCCATVKHNNLS